MFLFCFSVTHSGDMIVICKINGEDPFKDSNRYKDNVASHCIILHVEFMYSRVHCFAIELVITSLRYVSQTFGTWKTMDVFASSVHLSSSYAGWFSGFPRGVHTRKTRMESKTGTHNFCLREMIFLSANGFIFSLRHLFCTYVYQLSARSLPPKSKFL